MNIVLTSEDADSIISFLREHISNILEYQEDVTEEYKRLSDEYNKSDVISNSAFCKETFKETSDLFNERMKELDDKRKMLVHFIELLTCGSEVTE